MNIQTPLAAKNHSGFSLVELMVAMTLGLIVVGAVAYAYLGSRAAFRTTDNMSRMQESARYAIDALSRDVRMAGYFGCGSLSNLNVTTIANPPVPLITADTAIIGYDDGAGWVNPTAIVRAAGDVITIQGAFGGGVPIAGNWAPANAQVQTAGNPYGFLQNEVLVVANCTTADVFRATNVINGPTLSTFAHSNAGNSGNRVGTYGPDASLLRFEQYDYFIGINPNGRRALYRSSIREGAQELVENVENMQVMFGRDIDGDRSVDVYNNAAGVGANWNQVVAARINLLISSTENNLTTSPQTYNFDAFAVPAADRRIYQTFTTTIGVRNRLP